MHNLKVMNNKWSIWASVLMLTGILGLGAVNLERFHRRHQAPPDKQSLTDRTDQHFSLYDNNGQIKSDRQLRREQQARLKADLTHLAGNMNRAPIFADVLYGDNWRQEVKKYINKQKLMDAVAGTSAVSMLAGVIIGLTYHSQRVIPTVIGKFSRSRKQTDSDTPAGQDCAAAVVISPDKTDVDFNLHDKTSWLSDGRANETDSHTRWWQKQGQSLKLKAAFATQAATYNKAVEQPGCSAQTRQMATLMSTEPADNSLTELTQEVSAIRQFAAQQQDRVIQLQEGYDWTIIKRFCLRIIHCIDNLDSRIAEMSRQNHDTQYIEDVRDELIFALESSGVEQITPQIDADYKGLEKIAEAVRQRVNTEQEEMAGKIAKIVRRGYQYVLNENDVKVVRAAQVKLYG